MEYSQPRMCPALQIIFGEPGCPQNFRMPLGQSYQQSNLFCISVSSLPPTLPAIQVLQSPAKRYEWLVIVSSSRRDSNDGKTRRMLILVGPIVETRITYKPLRLLLAEIEMKDSIRLVAVTNTHQLPVFCHGHGEGFGVCLSTFP